MRAHEPGVWIDDSRKGEVGILLEGVKAVEKSRGSCLFVIDEDGRICGNPVDNNCHVISEKFVLGELKDSDSGKVLELRWGISRWQHLLVSGNGSNPINLNDTSAFDPQSVGTGNACVGSFACKDKVKDVDHDGEFWPIDVKEPDLSNPIVRFLFMYRAALYEVDMCRLAKQFARDWSKQALTHHDKGIRFKWTQLMSTLNSRTSEAKANASKLGKIWCGRKTHGELDPGTISGQALYFSSRLKFASSGFYGSGILVTVVPVGEYQHKMGIFHLSEDADSVKEDKERLIRLSSDSESVGNSGVLMVVELMKDRWSTIAASPKSYSELPDPERQAIQSSVASSLSADTLATSLNSRPPQPKGWRNRRKGR